MTQLTATLWERLRKKQDPAAREELIIQYAYLVKYIVERMALTMPAHVETDDLYGYGIFGLIDAIEKYNPESGVKFETYAPIRIKGAILDALRAQDWVPRSVRQQAKLLEKAYYNLECELGRTATDAEICAALGIKLEELAQLLDRINATSFLSLDETFNNDDGNYQPAFLDGIVDTRSPDPVVQAEQNELKEILAKAIDSLSEQERLVVSLYYYEELTLKEIGRVMGLSESRISQLHTKAILRLRGKLSRYKQTLTGSNKPKK